MAAWVGMFFFLELRRTIKGKLGDPGGMRKYLAYAFF